MGDLCHRLAYYVYCGLVRGCLYMYVDSDGAVIASHSGYLAVSS